MEAKYKYDLAERFSMAVAGLALIGGGFAAVKDWPHHEQRKYRENVAEVALTAKDDGFDRFEADHADRLDGPNMRFTGTLTLGNCTFENVGVMATGELTSVPSRFNIVLPVKSYSDGFMVTDARTYELPSVTFATPDIISNATELEAVHPEC